jgi:hypothetical protein
MIPNQGTYIYAIDGGLHAKDAVMDIVISSSLSKSCLQHPSTSSADYTLQNAENMKVTKDVRNAYPIQLLPN